MWNMPPNRLTVPFFQLIVAILAAPVSAQWIHYPTAGVPKTSGGVPNLSARTPRTAKVTERFRRPNYGSLEIDVTVDDPKAYTKPWTITFKQPIVLNTEMMDEICLENEKSVQHLVGK
jgi:hypothetical protein